MNKYAITQARLARILRASDWDNKRRSQYYGGAIVRDILLIVVESTFSQHNRN